LHWIHAGVIEAEKVVEGKCNRYYIKKSVLAALENDQTEPSNST